MLDPIAADPAGDWFTFEKGVEKTTGGGGWADVWRKDCFAWEYKGPGKDLDKALQQLLRYSRNLDNPPLLIVSDIHRIRVHTNFTNSVAEMHEFALEDLRDGEVRDRLKLAFTDPDAFKPAKTRQMLTEEVARKFATLAQRLRDREHDAQAVAHFVVRCAFCMFAEDVGLLPNHMFTRLVSESRRKPEEFAELASTLFGLMRTGGRFGIERVAWFNGGLFDDDAALPLNHTDIELLEDACKQHWSEIDPSILGTLFERGLDPAKRSQLGAHYTDRAKIELITGPVIAEPLTAEWTALLAQATAAVEAAEAGAAAVRERAASHGELKAEVRALETALSRGGQPDLFPDAPRQKLVRELDALAKEVRAATEAVRAARAEVRTVRDAFMAKLRDFRVLDPACGSGNFLYVALKLLKDIEHRVNVDAEALGVPLVTPEVGPANVLGIELNPFAAELARTSVWIGDIQWMRKNGFEPSRDPILKPLQTIECRDAVLAADGTRAEWPEADVVIGNPPFLGSKYHRKGRPATRKKPALQGLGDEYSDRLYRSFKGDVPASADLVSYWFAQLKKSAEKYRLSAFGLIATKSIGKGASNVPLAKLLAQTPFTLFYVWRNEPWVVDGADVRVAIVCSSRAPMSLRLDGAQTSSINPDLTNGLDITRARPLAENRRRAFQGVKLNGPFQISGDTAREFLRAPLNPNGRPNSDIVRRFVGNDDVTMRDDDQWVVDFSAAPLLEEAALYEAPFRRLQQSVAIAREGREVGKATEFERLEKFWLMQRPRPKLRQASVGMRRLIAVPETSEHLIFRYLPTTMVFSGSLFAICSDDDVAFGILSSAIHREWSRAHGNKLGVGNQGRYNATRTYLTFPFPEGLTPDVPAADYADDPRAQAIASAAARLNELRENWLNPPDLVRREPEVVPGYPDRILPVDEAAAKELKTRTLTNLYNQRQQWLVNAHAALDQTVADAYGWGAEWRAGMSDDDILARLFALNQARA